MLSPSLRAITLRICVSETSVYPSWPIAVKTGALAEADVVERAGADAGTAVGIKPSMSFLVILPPSPLPLTLLISMPLSAANFLANGDALILPSVPLLVSVAGTCAAGSF